MNWGDSTLPLHASALGKVFLAYGAEASRGAPAEIQFPDHYFEASLARRPGTVRERGWALADGELEAGLIAVAAPFLSADGSVVGRSRSLGPHFGCPGR